MLTQRFKIYVIIFSLVANLIVGLSAVGSINNKNQNSKLLTMTLIPAEVYAETESDNPEQEQTVASGQTPTDSCGWWESRWWNPFGDPECRIGQIAGSVSVFFANAASYGVELIIKAVGSLVLIDPQASELGNPDSHLANLWSFVRNITNSLFAIVLLIMAFAHMLRIDVKTYDLKVMLPKFFITIVLVNFSWIIGRVVIDLANVFSVYLLHINDGEFTNMVSNFDYHTVTSAGGQGAVGGFFMLILLVVIYILGFIMALFLLLQLIFRIVVVQILLILSPIAFGCNVLPFTKKIYSQWWGEFSKWVFMGPVTLFLLVIAERALVTYPYFEGPGSSYWLRPVFVAALLFAASTIPSSMGGKAMAGLDKFNAGAKQKGKNWALTGRTDGKGATGILGKVGYTQKKTQDQLKHDNLFSSYKAGANKRLAAGDMGARIIPGRAERELGYIGATAGGEEIKPGWRATIIDESQNARKASGGGLAEKLTNAQRAGFFEGKTVDGNGGTESVVDILKEIFVAGKSDDWRMRITRPDQVEKVQKGIQMTIALLKEAHGDNEAANILRRNDLFKDGADSQMFVRSGNYETFSLPDRSEHVKKP